MGWDAPTAPLAGLENSLEPWRSLNSYGLFAVMTTQRNEVVLEGSADGRTWTPYAFKWKPGDPARRPAFVAPYLPRLDWQLWFAALGGVQDNPWILNLMARLLQGEPSVLALLDANPFPLAPPRYVRALIYGYRFSTLTERARDGDWWERRLLGAYAGPYSLRNRTAG
jgi:hypothetical protein